MNNLAPRQGIFAVILLVSLCLHVVMLMFSTEKQQYDDRTQKGEKIVEQLSREAIVALANQDRISLSVLANRYQLDNDVAKLAIIDQNNQALVQVGQSQTQAGQVIDQPIIQDNRVLGHAVITMKAIAKGEIVSAQWLYILGSAILHGFLWLIYGYVARPTAQQLAQIGEKVQQRIAIARGLNTLDATAEASEDETLGEHTDTTATDTSTPKKSIQDFLQPPKTLAQGNTTAFTTAQTTNDTVKTQSDMQVNAERLSKEVFELQIRFADEYQLLSKVAPEIANPYLQLCEELLTRACDSLFSNTDAPLNRYLDGVSVETPLRFGKQGAVVHLVGSAQQLPLASILLAKLMIILNQVVYEKHRELSRFALPMTVGVGRTQQFDDMQRLMTNHAKEDGLLLLYPKSALKALTGQVQFKNLPQPTSVVERESVRYVGLSQTLMKALIIKRDAILTDNEKAYEGEI